MLLKGYSQAYASREVSSCLCLDNSKTQCGLGIEGRLRYDTRLDVLFD